MRSLRDHNKEQRDKLPTMGLKVAMKHLVLRTGDGSTVIMRHSTTRVAYSTVDPARPKTFAYVAVVKGTNLALCHVFNTKSNKQGYEMTFVCAHAFDLNLRHWSADKETAQKEATKSEKTDIRKPPPSLQSLPDPSSPIHCWRLELQYSCITSTRPTRLPPIHTHTHTMPPFSSS
jgi:hypothetical protein